MKISSYFLFLWLASLTGFLASMLDRNESWGAFCGWSVAIFTVCFIYFKVYKPQKDRNL